MTTRKLSPTDSILVLRCIVASTGLTGTWSGRNPFVFLASNGAILRWWPSTGTIVFQGPEKRRDAFEDAFDLAVAAYIKSTVPKIGPHKPKPSKRSTKAARRGGRS